MAWIAVLVALAALGGAMATTLGARIADAMRAADGASPATLGDAGELVVALVVPIVVVAAIAAFVAHVAQTRTLWIPQRRVPGAPGAERRPLRDGAIELVRAAVIGGVALGWLWLTAARIATGAEGLAISALAALGIALVAIATLDALVRHADHARALRMTHAEAREDERTSGADPRWRQARQRAARDPGVAGAAIVLVGETADGEPRAIAIAWDPMHRPEPACIRLGRGAGAMQLLALARRAGVAIHREPDVVRQVTRRGTIARVLWPRLAELVAAVRRA